MSLRFEGMQKSNCKECKKDTAIVSQHTANSLFKYCYSCDLLTIIGGT